MSKVQPLPPNRLIRNYDYENKDMYVSVCLYVVFIKANNKFMANTELDISCCCNSFDPSTYW